MSVFAPGKYFGIGLSLLSIGMIWKFSDAPYANWVALGTALISLGAFARSTGTSWAFGIILSCWATYVTVPAFVLAVSGLFAKNDAQDCVATRVKNSDQDVEGRADGLTQWLRGG